MGIDRYLLDSDVIIEHLRGRHQAKSFILALKFQGELLVSAITVAELFAGARHDPDKEAIEALLQLARIIPVNESIARQGGHYRQQFGRSHGTGLMDALIAATSESEGAKLVTFNRRHFPMIANLQVPYER
jgi:predicted nucleic acid-binding protein